MIIPYLDQGQRKRRGFLLFYITPFLGYVCSWLDRVRSAEVFGPVEWSDEHYHRGIKPFCGVERAQVRAARAQRNHIGLCLRAFLRLERYGYHAGISWFAAKTAIIRPAVQAYLATSLYTLSVTA